jgi:hypothetical protein
MPALAALLKSIQSSTTGLTLAELLAQHPDLARRTVQRWLSQWSSEGQITASGEGRARRYAAPALPAPASAMAFPDRFPTHIPLSADSRDILAYVDQPLQARRPVGYQRDFLDAYQPNVSGYLPESLRRQLHNMGKTTLADEPAGTYSRAILNLLVIDLS